MAFENGANVIPFTRAAFTADGQTAYTGTAIPGQNIADEYCFLYALRRPRRVPPGGRRFAAARLLHRRQPSVYWWPAAPPGIGAAGRMGNPEP